MADDTKKIGDLSKSTREAADATKDLGQQSREIGDVLRRIGTDVKPVSENFKYYAERLRELNKEQVTWVKLMANSRDVLRKYKDEMFGAEATMRRFTNTATGLADKFRGMIKLGAAWKGQVDIIRKAQADLSKATYLHTGDYATASATLQKSIDGVRQTNEKAREIQKKYGEEMGDISKRLQEIKSRFEGQLLATSNYSKSLGKLQENVYLIAKTMGVDTTKAMDYMQSRMQSGGKTIEAVQQETVLVAKATDAYVASMRKIPDVAQSAYMSQGKLLEQLQKVGEVMGPLVDSEMWAKLLTNLDVFGRKAGMTAQETAKMQGDTIKFMEGMQKADLSSLWAVQASRKAQQSGLIEELKKTGDAQTKRRMATLEKILASDQPEIKKMQATIAALKGETKFQQMAMESFTGVGTRAVQLQQMEGMGYDPFAAQVALDAMSKGGAIHSSLAESTDAQKEGAAKSTEASEYLGRMQKIAEERMKPQSAVDKATLETAQVLDRIEHWMKTSFWAQVAKTAIQGGLLFRQLQVLNRLYRKDSGKGERRNSLLRAQLRTLNRIARGGGMGGGAGRRRGPRSRTRWKGRTLSARRGGGGRAGALLSLGAMALPAGVLPAGVDTALDVGGTAADVAGAGLGRGGAAAARRGGAGAASKGAGWLAKAGRGAGTAARVGSKALRVLGPVGAVAGAGMLGWEVGKWIDKKTNASKHIGDALWEMDPRNMASKLLLEEMERTTEGRVGAKIIGGQGVDRLQTDGLKAIDDTGARAKAFVDEIRKGSGVRGKESHRKEFDKLLQDILKGEQTEYDLGSVGSILEAQMHTLKLRQKLEEAGLTEGDIQKQLGGPSGATGIQSVDKLGEYAANLAAKKQRPSALLPEQSINDLRAARQQQQQITMAVDKDSLGQSDNPQNGKFNATNGSMTYTMPGSTFMITLENLEAALYASSQERRKQGGTR